MKDTALIIIDIQNDYFPGGKMELDRAEAACDQVVSTAAFLDQSLT